MSAAADSSAAQAVPIARPIGRRVLYHADDLGATPSITHRLLDSWERGLVDGVSVFGCCDHAEEITDRLQSRPDRPARVAVHLNICEGRPLTPMTRISHLTDRHGYFNADFAGILNRYYLGATKRQRQAIVSEIEREWRAQIENVFRMIGGRPVHAVDGHRHVHMVPFLFRLAVQLAKDYGIPEIRNVREPFHLSANMREWSSKRFLVNCIKRETLFRLAKANAALADCAGVASPDRVVGVLYSGMMSRANITSGILAARRQRARTIEVLVHVGRANLSELQRWNGKAKKAAFAMSSWRDLEFAEVLRVRGRRLAGSADRRTL